MSTNPSPVTRPLLKLAFSILPLAFLASLVSCGGGTASFHQGGGGGHGAPCTPLPAVTTAPSTTKGVGQVAAPTFMDLHLGTTDIAWPSVQFGGLRLWDTSTGWAQINTSDGAYDWTTLDSFVAAAPAHGVDLLYNLSRTPTWASSNPNDSSCSYNTSAQGGPGQCDPPNDLNADGSGTDAHWIKWVSAVATRYKGKIKYYEIWNEWNVQNFWTHAGDLQQPQLVRMEQDARCVIEGPPPGLSCNSNSTFPSGTAIDPNARIVTPSPTGAHSVLNEVSYRLSLYFGTRVGNYNGGDFADIVGFHGYVGTGPNSGLCPVPEDVGTVIDDLNGTVNSFGQAGKPWFNTEGGWSRADQQGFTDEDRQAAFLPRYLLMQRSLGVDRVYWYRWDGVNQEDGALWNIGSGITKGGTAYGDTYKWISGATVSQACTPNGSVWSCGLTRPGGYKALAIWDASQDCSSSSCPTPSFSVPAGGYTLYRDVTGKESSISGGTVPLGGKPILLENAPLP